MISLKEGESYYLYNGKKIVVAKYHGVEMRDNQTWFKFSSDGLLFDVSVNTINVNALLVIEDEN